VTAPPAAGPRPTAAPAPGHARPERPARPRWSRRLGLLASRDFRLLWTGETTSSLGSSIGGVALPLAALTLVHAGVFAISALTAAAWLPWLLIGLPAGAWVDRLPRRRVMMAADLVSLAGFASVPVAAAAGLLTMAQLFAVALLAGAAKVFFATAYRAFLPAVLDPGDLLEGNAKLQGSEQVTNVAGPGLAGLITQLASAAGGVLADAVSFAVSAACLARLRVPETRQAAPRRRLHREIGEGLTVVWHDQLLRMNAIFGSVSNLLLTGYQAVQVVYLVKVVGLAPGVAGVALALTSLGGILGALTARRAAGRLGSARAVLLAKVGVMPFGLLIPLADRGPGLALYVLGSVVLVGGIVAGNIIWSGWVQSYYPPQLLGRVSTSVQVVNYGAIPLGAALAGLTAAHLGVRPTLWIMLSGLLLSGAILLAGPLRTLRDLPAQCH
jgi:predicted MFS family arabinose efflux permease